MSRINRIRRQIVAKALSTQGWWEESPLKKQGAAGMLEQGQLGRHLWRETVGRRRQIVERLFDLSTRDFKD